MRDVSSRLLDETDVRHSLHGEAQGELNRRT
jgi:hypothetical protein